MYNTGCYYIYFQSWCMVWVVICIVPYGLLVSETGMNVNWATLSTQVLTSPFLWPLFLTITWSKATSQGVIAGKLVFLVLYVFFMIHTYTDEMSTFYDFIV